MEREALIAHLALWLDTTVIAEAIVDALEQVEAPMTPQMGQSTWLAVLDGLHDELKSAAKAEMKKQ